MTPEAKHLVNADAPYGGLTAQSRKEPTVIADLTQTSTADLQAEVAMLRRYAKTLALVEAELRRRNAMPAAETTTQQVADHIARHARICAGAEAASGGEA